jgi:6-phosphogluconate dehydrogenase
LRSDPPAGQLVLAPGIRNRLGAGISGLRAVVGAATASGLPVPALSAALAWYDSLRQARGTTNLIQAQRDMFGTHGFERIDRDGSFHGDWENREGTA